MVNTYTFKSPSIQKEWEEFGQKAYDDLNAISAKVPKDINFRTKGIEDILENLMDIQFDTAKLLGRIEYFYEVACAEVMTKLYDDNPKTSVTVLKEQAGGKYANITALKAYGSHVWSAMERAMMCAQSLLKRVP
jgi:hypothetical protein